LVLKVVRVVVVIEVVIVVKFIKYEFFPFNFYNLYNPYNFFYKECNLPEKHVVIAYKYTVRVIEKQKIINLKT